MLGEIWYIFRKYGEQLAEKYGYERCYMQLTTDGGGHLAGYVQTNVASGCSPIWQPFSVTFLSWVSLDDAVKLLRKEVREILESGGKTWN